MSTDFEREIVGIAQMIKPAGYELAPETISIAAESLEEIDRKYGPDSDHPLAFHNAPHSVGVTRRTVRLTNMLYPFIRAKYQDGIFDLAIIAGADHDHEQELGPDANEEASSEDAQHRVEEAGGVLTAEGFKKRLGDGILATTVEPRGDNNELVQVNLQTGTHDPIKFIMAFSDINGIAMEGSKRMWQDATNLYYEITEEPTIEGLFNFYANQADFLKQRLNDGRVKSDIAYYFPNDIEGVYGVMRQAFHKKIVSAHSLTLLLKQRPELRESVGIAAKTLDKSTLGGAVGKMLLRKLT